jgi:hypothetical protein
VTAARDDIRRKERATDWTSSATHIRTQLIIGLAKQASQITMYDVKSYYNQAKNMVLNLSEMEAKVAEATNNDPW